MPLLNTCLVADGPSDASLIPILRWVVAQHMPGVVAKCEWADLRRLPTPPTALEEKIRTATELYPCELLFIHRDAENHPPDQRYGEVTAAIAALQGDGVDLPHVCIVPVRMQEAWMLLDEMAIRRAAGNPNGRALLNLPAVARIESLPDPKGMLYDLIRTASGLRGRRLKKLRMAQRAKLVGEYIVDYVVLRELPAFQRLEDDFKAIAARLGLDGRAGNDP